MSVRLAWPRDFFFLVNLDLRLELTIDLRLTSNWPQIASNWTTLTSDLNSNCIELTYIDLRLTSNCIELTYIDLKVFFFLDMRVTIPVTVPVPEPRSNSMASCCVDCTIQTPYYCTLLIIFVFWVVFVGQVWLVVGSSNSLCILQLAFNTRDLEHSP